jgi:hypothetical protein
MHALAFLLGSRALAVARSSNAGRPPREEPLGPIASTPETAAAWRRWRNAGAAMDIEPRTQVAHGVSSVEASPG